MMALRQESTATSPRLKVLAVLLLVLCLWCWLEGRALASNRSSCLRLTAQIEKMNADSAVIRGLREAPQLAVERERPNDELLAEVRDAMAAAKMPAECWIGNDPSPAMRIPRTPYKRLSVRLLFEAVELKRLVAFAHEIVGTDTALTIQSLRLTAPANRKEDTWNTDIVLSYLLYSPYQER